MKVVCGWCGVVKQEGGGEISHGICETCAIMFRLQSLPALMKPKADRYADCYGCQFCAYDFDGVPESCDRLRGEKCIRTDRRSPWQFMGSIVLVDHDREMEQGLVEIYGEVPGRRA